MFASLKQIFARPASAALPAVPAGQRVYAIGDVHGRLDLLDMLLDQIEEDDRAGAPADGTLVFLGDHAGALIPQALGTLGVGEADRRRHIALDIGVARLGRLLAEHFAAPFVSQAYSRLVIDCNRDPADPTAMPPVSDGTPVPGNADLSAADRAARVAAMASSIRCFFSFISTSVAAPTLITATPPASFATRSCSFSRS